MIGRAMLAGAVVALALSGCGGSVVLTPVDPIVVAPSSIALGVGGGANFSVADRKGAALTTDASGCAGIAGFAAPSGVYGIAPGHCSIIFRDATGRVAQLGVIVSGSAPGGVGVGGGVGIGQRSASVARAR